MSKLTVQNSLELLHPTLRSDVEWILVELRKLGFEPVVFETGRTQERQNYLFSKGASKKTYSKHQDGRAVDIIEADAGWKSKPFFDALAAIAEQRGLSSGHRWKWRDSAHIELKD